VFKLTFKFISSGHFVRVFHLKDVSSLKHSACLALRQIFWFRSLFRCWHLVSQIFLLLLSRRASFWSLHCLLFSCCLKSFIIIPISIQTRLIVSWGPCACISTGYKLSWRHFNGTQSAYCDQLIVLIVWFLDGSNHEIALDLVLVGFLIDSKKRWVMKWNKVWFIGLCHAI